MRPCEICGNPLKKKQVHCCCIECRRIWEERRLAAQNRPIKYCQNPRCKIQLDRKHDKYCSVACMEMCKKNVGGKAILEKKIATEFKIMCKCPACGELHEQFYPYRPKMTPRIYCETHSYYRNRSDDD